uniref:Uncharacterized protein n=1 Tax=Lactuca sativa TaxID=4236 RepID=A0A9R1WYS6_LACSA|nr:hypothetical protein LSAT_V11C800402770 [Lactuca sativa]
MASRMINASTEMNSGDRAVDVGGIAEGEQSTEGCLVWSEVSSVKEALVVSSESDQHRLTVFWCGRRRLRLAGDGIVWTLEDSRCRRNPSLPDQKEHGFKSPNLLSGSTC